MTRSLLILALVGLARLAAAGGMDLTNPPQTLKGKKDRGKARAVWMQAKPAYDLANAGKPVAPDRIVAAVTDIEKAVSIYERTLRREWNADANRELCECVKAWYKLRPLLPKPQPANDDEKKKLAKQAKRARRAELSAARKMVMEFSAAQRHTKLMRRCPSCEGRKEHRSGFGDRRPCQTCAKEGFLPDYKGIVKARWAYFSPFYRQNSRKLLQVNRAMQQAAHNPDRLAPFIRSVSIKKVEEHGTWIRIRALVKTYATVASKRDVKEKRTFTIYRVGRIWWVHDPQVDPDFLMIPVEETPKKSE